jgi:hypothetical protein
MPPSTVYKGDLSEISFGHESGIVLEDNMGTNDLQILFGAKDTIADTSVVYFDTGTDGTPVNADEEIQFPLGMLVGCKVAFSNLGAVFNSKDNYEEGGKTFTIVKQTKTQLTLSPALSSNHSTGSPLNTHTNSSGEMHILPFKTPTMDVNMGHHADADEATESVLTDQFVGVVGTVALPETKVDLKRFHVVGLGRDVAVQVPGRFINTGGSFEANIHNSRWFYYALGHESVKMPIVTSGRTADSDQAVASGSTVVGLSQVPTGLDAGDAAFNQYGQYIGHITAASDSNASSTITFGGGTKTAITAGETLYYSPAALCNAAVTVATSTSINPGDSYFKYSGTAATELAGDVAPAVGDYVWIPEGAGASDANLIDINTHRETSSDGVWPVNGADSIISKSTKTEIRRIAAIEGGHIWVDDPFCFSHPSASAIYFTQYNADNTKGSPNLVTTSGSASYATIQNPVEKIMFSRSTVPSFAMEVSIRRNDTDTSGSTTSPVTDEVTDGSASDTKQLTRVFRGCKVKDFSLKADTDAALRMTVNFDSALCYTDTGRLEGTKGDRYNSHRLFEDTGETLVNRKKAGIAKRTQKPFMFYNGFIKVKGVTLGQVTSFTLNGSTGVQQFYTITGANVDDAETDQTPFAGTRNPAIAVEGKTEYNLDLEIIVDDPVFYHNMRRAVENYDDTTTDTTDSDMIRLSFTKQGGTGTKESLDIVIDDYFITEAPLPVPEDKGPIRSALKIAPKSIRVHSTDTVFHS